MKWRHWAILIVLVLLNYIIFSTAFTQLAEQRRPGPRPTRTPQPTFESIEANPVAWIVLPTSTLRPTRTPVTPTPTQATPVIAEATPTLASAAATSTPTATNTPIPPTATPTSVTVIHTVKSGETLSKIASDYGVTVQAIMRVNNLTDPDRISVGQKLVIPAPGQSPPTVTVKPKPTNTRKPRPPTPTPTRKPPTATPTPTAMRFQFTAKLIWDPQVAPNCSGPAISKQSIIRDASGNPVNGARVEVNCYGNIWLSHPSGNPGEYEPGHYDFAFGQTSPQDWVCTARMNDVGGQPVASSETVSIHFDTNDCRPGANGHQVAIVNWTKNW